MLVTRLRVVLRPVWIVDEMRLVERERGSSSDREKNWCALIGIVKGVEIAIETTGCYLFVMIRWERRKKTSASGGFLLRSFSHVGLPGSLMRALIRPGQKKFVNQFFNYSNLEINNKFFHFFRKSRNFPPKFARLNKKKNLSIISKSCTRTQDIARSRF